ncbi:MAG TPA: aldo/keto reductase [Stellaceae bacterium]|jgi:aryl-alcohol dehydrogenase-like predicted oxidoreductase
MPGAEAAGTFAIGDDITVNRLGFGAMRIVGPGVWGEPADRASAVATLESLPGLGVDFVDTADCYGPNISERLIREVLHPYPGMMVATKAGYARSGPGQWETDGRPDHLRRQALDSRQRLGVERIDLWQLHRIDPQVPREAQFAAMRGLIDDGVVRHVGLSEVSIADIEAARAYFPVATVQNQYNLFNRVHEGVLDYCASAGIGFIAFYPLGSGKLVRRATEGTPLAEIAKTHGATPNQIALAWLLRRSPALIPIPGTGKPAHLAENVAAAAIRLSDTEFTALDRMGRG